MVAVSLKKRVAEQSGAERRRAHCDYGCNQRGGRGARDGVRSSFFKQKTAYEIMSGDWSSDVCSSD
eukprot:SAG22_NODE_20996_length_261_cov_0.537037_1_plen_65_part_01